MAIDTKNERMSIIGWPGMDALAFPDGDMDKEDRLIMVGLPAVDAVTPSGGGINGKTGFSLSLGFFGFGGADK